MEVNIKKLEKESLFLDGKTKKLYQTNNPDYLFMEYKNDLVVPDGKKIIKVRGKSQINNEVSSHVFQFLDSYHIPNHYVGRLDEKSCVVKKVDIIPINVVIRNIAAGSFAKNYKLDEGQVLPAPVIEFYFKNDKLGNPMINEYHLYAFGYSNQDEVRTIQRLAAKVNAVLRNFFERRNFKLVDFKLEFGRSRNNIYLADEISLDTVRLWEVTSDRKIEKEIAHGKETEVGKLYAEIKQKLIHPKNKEEKNRT